MPRLHRAASSTEGTHRQNERNELDELRRKCTANEAKIQTLEHENLQHQQKILHYREKLIAAQLANASRFKWTIPVIGTFKVTGGAARTAAMGAGVGTGVAAAALGGFTLYKLMGEGNTENRQQLRDLLRIFNRNDNSAATRFRDKCLMIDVIILSWSALIWLLESCKSGKMQQDLHVVFSAHCPSNHKVHIDPVQFVGCDVLDADAGEARAILQECQESINNEFDFSTNEIVLCKHPALSRPRTVIEIPAHSDPLLDIPAFFEVLEARLDKRYREIQTFETTPIVVTSDSSSTIKPEPVVTYVLKDDRRKIAFEITPGCSSHTAGPQPTSLPAGAETVPFGTQPTPISQVEPGYAGEIEVLGVVSYKTTFQISATTGEGWFRFLLTDENNITIKVIGFSDSVYQMFDLVEDGWTIRLSNFNVQRCNPEFENNPNYHKYEIVLLPNSRITKVN